MSSRQASVAILPFENLSASPGDVRLAGGFVQELIAELARFPSIGVIAAESAFAVEHLLKGSLRRSARSLRLSARLVQLSSGQHLWADPYDVPNEEPNPLRPWAFGGKGAEGLKKDIPSNNDHKTAPVIQRAKNFTLDSHGPS